MSTCKLFINIVLACSLLCCNSTVTEEPGSVIHGKVIAVKNGDTIEILYDRKALRFRLAHIDCPEIRKSQPFGRAATQKASDLCFGQEVRVLHEGKFDRYGSLIAEIINAENQNVNKEMMRAGLAWHYVKYSSDNDYVNLEIGARKNKMGIWAEDNPTPP